LVLALLLLVKDVSTDGETDQSKSQKHPSHEEAGRVWKLETLNSFRGAVFTLVANGT